jgi:hypothetical protein
MAVVIQVIMILTQVRKVPGKVAVIVVVTGFQHQNQHQRHQVVAVAENQHHQVVAVAEMVADM